MISNLIVLSSVLLAGWFTLQYLLRPALREQVELPKYLFLQQLARHDRLVASEKGFAPSRQPEENERQEKTATQAEPIEGKFQ